MKAFALKHPAIFSLLVFLVIFVGVTAAGPLLLLLLEERCKPQYPGDPCDGEAMIFYFVGQLSFWTGLFGGIVIAYICFEVLKYKAEKREP